MGESKARDSAGKKARAARRIATDEVIVAGVKVAAGEARGGKGPTAGPWPRWTAERVETFFSALAATANVTGAARAARISLTHVYRQRQRSAAFRQQWMAAMTEAYATLEAELLRRAIGGVLKPVWHAGEKVGRVREFSDRVGIMLLKMHRDTVAGTAPMATDNIEELRARLRAKLSEMNRRMGGAG